ncbi:MAG TPA: hypothetical protein VFW13_15445 [Phenylobacterium sp.]|nr:hypothetical protein [Phenylobacterium sp.]
MRLLAIAVLAVSLSMPGLVLGQEALDPAPMAWRGVQLGPEQIFEGDFSINYETSAFTPDGAPKSEAMWLAGWQEHPGDNGDLQRRYHVRFVGRRTVEPGRYGSLGAYKHTVLITKLISARLLILH